MNNNFNKYKNNKLSKKYYNDLEISEELNTSYKDISTPDILEAAKKYPVTKLELKDKKNNKLNRKIKIKKES